MSQPQISFLLIYFPYSVLSVSPETSVGFLGWREEAELYYPPHLLPMSIISQALPTLCCSAPCRYACYGSNAKCLSGPCAHTYEYSTPTPAHGADLGGCETFRR